MPSAFRYILYARKSSEEKTKQVQSIDDQIHALEPLIERDDLTVVEILTESRSAKAPGRPVFGRMLELIQKGQADAILCWHLNRLTRNEMDSGTIRWLLRQGIIKEIVTPHRTYRPEDNALITAVESAMGEQFLVELIENSQRGMLSKVDKGWFPGKVPQGYKNDIYTHTIGRDPERWEIVQKAWRVMASGGATVPQIAERMSREWGYRAPRGSAAGMARTTLYSIFTNPFYTGVFAFQGRLYPGKHEAMVTAAEYAAVQRLLGRTDDGVQRRNRTHEFAYSGLIRCGYCGRMVTADRKRKVLLSGEERFYTYYACSRGSRCNRHRIAEPELERRLTAELAKIEMPESFFTYAREVAVRFREEEHRAEVAVREAQARALADTERQIQELLSLRLKALIDDGEYQQRKGALQAERGAVLMNAAKTTQAMENAWETAERVAAFCARAASDFIAGGVGTRGLLAGQMGVSYVLRGSQLTVETNGLLDVVRAHKEKGAVVAASLEPAETGSESDENGCLDPRCQEWGALLDAIRTKAYQESLSFGRYPLTAEISPL